MKRFLLWLMLKCLINHKYKKKLIFFLKDVIKSVVDEILAVLKNDDTRDLDKK